MLYCLFILLVVIVFSKALASIILGAFFIYQAIRFCVSYKNKELKFKNKFHQYITFLFVLGTPVWVWLMCTGLLEVISGQAPFFHF